MLDTIFGTEGKAMNKIVKTSPLIYLHDSGMCKTVVISK